LGKKPKQNKDNSQIKRRKATPKGDSLSKRIGKRELVQTHGKPIGKVCPGLQS